jgi:hypothetical protein
MQPKNPSQESSNPDVDTFPLPVEQAEPAPSQPELTPGVDYSSQVESAESAPASVERHLSDPEQNQNGTALPSLPQLDNGAVQDQTATPGVQPASTTQDDDDTPLIADDVDVIEKEWVDKAKQIIEQTRNNPYRQEQEVERLQQSYLKKRYGKDVSSANQV